MCACLHRRQFGLLAAGVAGAGLLPRRAEAAGCREALVLTCIDCLTASRLPRALATAGYDELPLAGASLAPVSAKFAASSRAFWDHERIARTLHHAGKLIVVDHRGCDTFKIAFGSEFAAEPAAETAQHKSVMAKLKAALEEGKAGLETEFYLMGFDGSAERLL